MVEFGANAMHKLKESAVVRRFRQEKRIYQHNHDQPLEGYAAAMSLFAGGVLAATAVGLLVGRKAPNGFRLADVVLGGIATHKLARIVAKDAVMSPLRVPFTRFEEPTGAGEVAEEVRDEGTVRTAFGELISCPFCLAPWIASAYTAGLVLTPRMARTWAAVFTTVAISGWLQHVYAHVRTD
ncbi:DUF1360 domain-containing protein [Flindersiella endophytica]